jgi:hypothetical protein
MENTVHGGGKRCIHKLVAGEFFLEREHDQRRPAKLNSLMVDDREALSGNPAGNQPDNG